MSKLKRIYIYAADVSDLTGKCIRTSYKIMRQVRMSLRKEAHQLVTFEEFHKYMGSPNSSEQCEKEKLKLIALPLLLNIFQSFVL